MSKYNLQPNSIQPKHEQIFHEIISAEMLHTESVFLNAHLHNNHMKHTPIKRNQPLTEQQVLVVYCDQGLKTLYFMIYLLQVQFYLFLKMQRVWKQAQVFCVLCPLEQLAQPLLSAEVGQFQPSVIEAK